MRWSPDLPVKRVSKVEAQDACPQHGGSLLQEAWSEASLPWSFSKLLSIHTNETIAHMDFHSPLYQFTPHRWAVWSTVPLSLSQCEVNEDTSLKSSARSWELHAGVQKRAWEEAWTTQCCARV